MLDIAPPRFRVAEEEERRGQFVAEPPPVPHVVLRQLPVFPPQPIDPQRLQLAPPHPPGPARVRRADLGRRRPGGGSPMTDPLQALVGFVALLRLLGQFLGELIALCRLGDVFLGGVVDRLQRVIVSHRKGSVST